MLLFKFFLNVIVQYVQNKVEKITFKDGYLKNWLKKTKSLGIVTHDKTSVRMYGVFVTYVTL